MTKLGLFVVGSARVHNRICTSYLGICVFAPFHPFFYCVDLGLISENRFGNPFFNCTANLYHSTDSYLPSGTVNECL
jgi:hypothetical protein